MAGKKMRGNTKMLAEILSVTQRRINQLTADGIFKKEDNGDFVIPDAVDAYYQRRYLADDTVDLKREQALSARAKREITEIQLKKIKGQMHNAADVEKVMSDMLTNLRTQLLAVPSRMANTLAGREPAEIESLLSSEIEARLTELSNYSPDLFRTGDDDDAEQDTRATRKQATTKAAGKRKKPAKDGEAVPKNSKKKPAANTKNKRK